MIKRLGLHIGLNSVLFVDSRKGFEVVAQAINMLSKKVDELVDENNKLRKRVSDLELNQGGE